MKKLLFVFNPHSGKAQIKNRLLDILNLFQANDYEMVVHPTQARLDAYELVKNSEGLYDIIVCSGGDGTLNETIAGLMNYKPENRPLIGYIPSGSTNDFAHSLGIPKDMQNAAETIIAGKTFLCDIGSFNERYFNYVAAFGAFTEVSYATSQTLKNMLGHQAYILEGVKQVGNIKAKHLKLEYNGETVEDDFIFGMFTNTKSVGGFKGIVGKGVKLNDGLFEGTFIRVPRNAIELQSILASLLNQKPDRMDKLLYFKTNELKITSDEAIPWVIDGEFAGNQTEITMKVNKEAANIIVGSKYIM
ncbi:diacylglycerol kinase family lipid kinase [Falcatimonas sp. MSJ-15]|uniref:diacylglycerol/lipid kinase family protein n=1 Tax=Falcatimonas sp. MSJ-15 TaxID=2841515 RepID=UPI001C12941F|nr:diacylglycerol kinase family protein [Falcatimonas sp. MSJ-15]MBU5469199.1 diacylglycerol kinase family lipid kinase [Falcatimonas sp. MSJ-15]